MCSGIGAKMPNVRNLAQRLSLGVGYSTISPKQVALFSYLQKQWSFYIVGSNPDI